MRFSIKKIFFALILITPLVSLLFIYSLWNAESRFSPEQLKLGGNKKITFSVDKCLLRDGILYASGWAFINSPAEKQKIIITIFRDGEYFSPQTMINNRADVSEIFKRGTDLDHSGFNFSTKVHSTNDASFNINIISNGVLFSEAYTCH